MITTTYYSFIDSPLGPLLVQGDGEVVTGLFLSKPEDPWGIDASWQKSDAPFARFAPAGRVLRGHPPGVHCAHPARWHAIPATGLAGVTANPLRQDHQLCPTGAAIGKPSASRAVGNANSRNPISIIVPCHRVIGADGKLTGYAGGIANKDWLLHGNAAARLWERKHYSMR